MAVKEYVKRIWRNNSNINDWAGWNAIKGNAETIGSIVKGMGKEDQGEEVKINSFQDAVKFYGLTEADLKKRMKSHLYTAIFSLVLGVAALVWTLHLLIIKAMFLSSMVSLGLTVLMLSYAFREHFFYYKIKEKRLNCTVSQWLQGFFSKKRSR